MPRATADKATSPLAPGLRTQRRAARAERRLQSVLDALPQGVVVLDSEGRYLSWNDRYAEIYHCSADLFRRGGRLMTTLLQGVERGG